jgi:hypothetical protein
MMIGKRKTVNGESRGRARTSQAQKKAGLERARLKVLAT